MHLPTLLTWAASLCVVHVLAVGREAPKPYHHDKRYTIATVAPAVVPREAVVDPVRVHEARMTRKFGILDRRVPPESLVRDFFSSRYLKREQPSPTPTGQNHIVGYVSNNNTGYQVACKTIEAIPVKFAFVSGTPIVVPDIDDNEPEFAFETKFVCEPATPAPTLAPPLNSTAFNVSVSAFNASTSSFQPVNTSTSTATVTATHNHTSTSSVHSHTSTSAAHNFETVFNYHTSQGIRETGAMALVLLSAFLGAAFIL